MRSQTPKINLDLLNKTQHKINQHEIKFFVKKALLNFLPQAKSIYLGIFFVDLETITKLNAKFRQKPCSGTVLSFPQDEPLKKGKKSGTIVLGDIFLCPAKIEQRSEEIYFYLWHGLLHLLGLNHEQMQKYNSLWKKMRKSQQ